MFVELIELLRCPRDHEESNLVATAERTEARHIRQGTLGCPVCRAEFAIRDGEALFDADARPGAAEPPDVEAAMRLAAFLELTDARGVAILAGRWGSHAGELHRLSGTPLLLVNPPRSDAGVAGVVRVGDALPLAAGVARAAALDDALPPALIASIVRAVRLQGRLVGPASLALPAGVTELVRDDRQWVGEKTAAPDHPAPAPRLVSLTRA